MSWVPDALQSRIDDTRRRIEAAEQAARSEAKEIIGAVREKAQVVVDKAANTVAEGTNYANDVVDAAKHAVREAPAKATANLPAMPGADYRAMKAVQKEAAPKKADPQAAPPPSFAMYTDEALAQNITAQRFKRNALADGPERAAASRDLQAMESEAQRRAEKPDDAANPELPVDEPTMGQKLRPVGMFVAGVGTGLVTGSLGLPGAAAQMRISAEVDARGSAQDKFAFGVGQELAGAFHIGHGLEMEAGAGAGEAVTAGLGTPIAVPIAAIGVMEMGGGAAMIANGQALAAKGSVSGAAPPRPTQSKTPTGIDDKHILNGEVKYDKSGKPRAVGFHHESSTTEGTARIARDATRETNAKGILQVDKVEIKDPRTGQWVTKPGKTTFFPKDWSRSRVREEIREAYANRKVIDGSLWEGVSSSGLDITGYVDSQGAVTSAFPDF